MENKEAGPVYLRRIDPSQNMRRFYALAIQPTLFGGHPSSVTGAGSGATVSR